MTAASSNNAGKEHEIRKVPLAFGIGWRVGGVFFRVLTRDSCRCSRPLSRICEDGRPRRRSGTLQCRPIACPGSWEIRRPTTPSITSFPAPRNRSKPSLSSKGDLLFPVVEGIRDIDDSMGEEGSMRFRLFLLFF